MLEKICRNNQQYHLNYFGNISSQNRHKPAIIIKNLEKI